MRGVTRGVTRVGRVAGACAVLIVVATAPAEAQAARTPVNRGAARATDRWFAADKVKHAALAFFVQSVAHSTTRAMGAGRGPSVAAASVVTAIVSVGKEWHDRRTTGFGERDLAWDMAGAGIATVLLRRTAR